MVEFTPGTGDSKPDLTEAVLPEPRPETEPKMARPTRTINKPDRLIESK